MKTNNVDKLLSHFSAEECHTAAEELERYLDAGYLNRSDSFLPTPGTDSDATPPSDPTPQQPTDAARPDPADLVREGEFSGLSPMKAAAAVLGRVGSTRPLTTKELYAESSRAA